MPNFKYNSIKSGSKENGMVTADDIRSARSKLISQGHIVLNISQINTKQKQNKNSNENNFSNLLNKVSIKKSSIELSFKQLSSVLFAGVPILTALTAIGNQAPGALRKVFQKITAKVRQGYSLHKSFSEEAPFIGKVPLGLISVGEANGTLDEMLEYASELMERSRKVKGQIVQAFAYPSLVILGALGVGYYMVEEVFPKIIKFISKQGKDVDLPLPTRILLQVNDFMNLYGVYLLLAPILLAVLFVWAKNHATIGIRVDKALLKIPLIGKAFKNYSNAMWCRTLGALLKSGVDVLTALDLVQETMHNKYYIIQFTRLKETIKQGGSLTNGIENSELKKLCPMSLTMVSVSETSGGLDESLISVAVYSEEQLNRRVAFLSKMVEPAIFGIVGGMVGFIYFAFFMAMMTASNSAG